jgi:hypothetical protein
MIRPMTPADVAKELRLSAARRLRDALAMLPASRWEHRAEYDAEIEKIKAIVQSEGGALIDQHWNGAIIRMHGIRSTSTSGVAQACRNWLARAEA